MLAKAFDKMPTFLAFPLWCPSDDICPKQLTDVALAARSCNATACRLQAGAPSALSEEGEEAGDVVQEDKCLGLSFIAMDGSLRNVAGLARGTVDDLFEPGFGGKGCQASACSEVGGDAGALIEFEQKFQDIPSVIVMPQIKEEKLFGVALEAPWASSLSASRASACRLPSALVEHVATSQVLIKARIADVELFGENLEKSTRPIAFSFVTVGPVAQVVSGLVADGRASAGLSTLVEEILTAIASLQWLLVCVATIGAHLMLSRQGNAWSDLPSPRLCAAAIERAERRGPSEEISDRSPQHSCSQHAQGGEALAQGALSYRMGMGIQRRKGLTRAQWSELNEVAEKRGKQL